MIVRLNVRYAGYGDATIVSDVTLDVTAGKLLLLVGGNASGKSTLLKAAVGLTPVVDGIIEVHGRNEILCPGRRLEYVSYMPQGKVVFPSLTVWENLEVAAFGRVRKEFLSRMAEFEAIGIEISHFRHLIAGQLSGGQRQMVGLVMALMRRPHVVLLDEPCAGLDAVASATIRDVIERLKREWKMAVVVAEHRVDIFAPIADSACALRDGRIIFNGSVSDLDRPGIIESIFGLAERSDEMASSDVEFPTSSRS